MPGRMTRFQPPTPEVHSVSQDYGQRKGRDDAAMDTERSITDPENWTVYGIPTFLTDQVAPGDVVAFSMVYEPTDARRDRWRIIAVKVKGLDCG